jgi:stage IV sporulation protein FB
VLAEPERTAYDLRFRFLGFPVRVHPFFWLLTVLINGDTLLRIGPEYLLMWIGVVFVSILIHELGHALAFRRYGADAEIILYAFGGLAVSRDTVSGRGRRIAVALAGPAAGFIVYGILYGTNAAFEWARDSNGRPTNGPELYFLYLQLVWVNLYWGLLNLLPVFPLDGGQVSRELCLMKWGTRGTRLSLKISFVVALLMVAYCVFCAIDVGQFGGELTRQLPSWVPLGSLYVGILFGFLAYESYRLLQRIEWTDTHWDDKVPWER